MDELEAIRADDEKCDMAVEADDIDPVFGLSQRGGELGIRLPYAQLAGVFGEERLKDVAGGLPCELVAVNPEPCVITVAT